MRRISSDAACKLKIRFEMQSSQSDCMCVDGWGCVQIRLSRFMVGFVCFPFCLVLGQASMHPR